MQGAPTEQHVGDTSLLKRAHIGPRAILTKASEAPKQQADVSGRKGHPLLSFHHAQATSPDQVCNEGAYGVGQALLDRGLGHRSPGAVGARDGQGDHRRLARVGLSVGG